jgi:hypothetical protein
MMKSKTTRALLGGLILTLVGWFAAQACFPILRPPAPRPVEPVEPVCYNDQGIAEPCPVPAAGLTEPIPKR